MSGSGWRGLAFPVTTPLGAAAVESGSPREWPLRLTLPYPPSANKRLRPIGPGRAILTKAANAYRSNVHAAAVLQGIGAPHLAVPLVLSILATEPLLKRTRDLDNLLKVPLDALKWCGVLDDDRWIKTLHVDWLEPPAGAGLLLLTFSPKMAAP